MFIRKSFSYGTACPPITRDIEDIVTANLAFFKLSRNNDLEPIDCRDNVVLKEAATIRRVDWLVKIHFTALGLSTQHPTG